MNNRNLSAPFSDVDRIDAVLPQTQCTQCGYPGCRPYAEAIATEGAGINRCPPGGQATILELARVTGRSAAPLDPDCGHEEPLGYANIVEGDCIGCTLCIDACPVDAIVGAPKRMHTVVAELCTGCKLCVPPCPVDCIVMLPARSPWNSVRAGEARARFEARRTRKARDQSDARANRLVKATHDMVRSNFPGDVGVASHGKKAIIEAALERARLLRAGRGEPSK